MTNALAPFTLKGFYLLTWGTALGTNAWHIVSMHKAFSTLDRESFAHLQARMHPAYFGTSTLLTGALLATHLYFHPVLLRRAAWWGIEEGVQGLLIVAAFVPQLINWVAVGPRAIRLAYERHRAERAGKDTPAQDLAAATSAVSTVHGVSSALNLVSGLSLAALGLAVSM
ncbi:hypothetical protein CcaverHIS002_0405220 [Cutaneotrichosporon cavernicola]|uniref:TMEM205-like domain-containing protein n=1 Tax=Cutaneotrichosporon cavernicola TaxID=279322 RepID=A0AA48L4A2_9TREE|nr:uncharacterized protein CcaverHIS019_0405190 [Cutaneotrichosporon cavernicola]BEI83918.1 hypothetical protein CcaverHIS002_0405220 [Cutaneotrichosporon cavernicola]BEI91699.1 hypothetical protein CcaverHIS019_0405190 [Cutaneotrichosporon cavernicola]BEI99473.1 hypothetical protein CcaverHIS631_0405160 [Cutaneotrichosporon cavernicola]BEJ07251.1 hypothetical protein CcaverHIS641_0405200 [Cutaneotrichosporon cavernicola]